MGHLGSPANLDQACWFWLGLLVLLQLASGFARAGSGSSGVASCLWLDDVWRTRLVSSISHLPACYSGLILLAKACILRVWTDTHEASWRLLISSHILWAEANLKAKLHSRAGEMDSKVSLKECGNREWQRIIASFAIHWLQTPLALTFC